MFNIRLAKLVIGIDNQYSYIEEQCRDYKTGDMADFVLKPTNEDIEKEDCEAGFDKGYLESLAVYRAVAERLIDYDGFLLHGAIIDVNDCGIAFLARSGVGKSTHIGLWKQMLRDKCRIINGDKPLIRIESGKTVAYGTPWSGKEGFNINSSTVLKDICFLKRSEDNYIREIRKTDAVKLLMYQIYSSKNPMKRIKTLELIDAMMKNVRVWEIGCNMDISAAKTVYDKIFEVTE